MWNLHTTQHLFTKLFILNFIFRGDPLSNTEVNFHSKADAIAFCEKNGEILLEI